MQISILVANDEVMKEHILNKSSHAGAAITPPGGVFSRLDFERACASWRVLYACKVLELLNVPPGSVLPANCMYLKRPVTPAYHCSAGFVNLQAHPFGWYFLRAYSHGFCRMK